MPSLVTVRVIMNTSDPLCVPVTDPAPDGGVALTLPAAPAAVDPVPALPAVPGGRHAHPADRQAPRPGRPRRGRRPPRPGRRRCLTPRRRLPTAARLADCHRPLRVDTPQNRKAASLAGTAMDRTAGW